MTFQYYVHHIASNCSNGGLGETGGKSHSFTPDVQDDSAFPNQVLDFYGALRSATYDIQIREWIEKDVVAGHLTGEDANLAEMTKRLVNKYGVSLRCSKVAVTSTYVG